MDDERYRREADQKWRERTDERLVSLTTDATVIHDRLDELTDDADALKKQVYGNPDADREGLIKGLHDLTREISKLNSVVFQDSTGKRGIAHDVDVLMGRKTSKDETLKLRWSFWTAILVALISSGALVLSNMDKLRAFFPRAALGPVAPSKRLKKRARPLPAQRLLDEAKDAAPPE